MKRSRASRKRARSGRHRQPAQPFVASDGAAVAAPRPPGGATRWRATLPCVTLIVVATVYTFLPAINNQFVYWDDENNLMFNRHIRSLSWENLQWMATSSLLSVWQPLTWLLTALEYQIVGSDDAMAFSRGMHQASIVLHALASALCFLVARRLIFLAAPQRAARSPIGLNAAATFAALLFAVHPLRAEIVAWASGQPYILAMLATLGCVWCHVKRQETRHRLWYWSALVCFSAAVLCKSIAVSLFVILLILDVYPLRRFGGKVGWRFAVWWRPALEKIPFALVAAVIVMLTVWATWTTRTYAPQAPLTKLMIVGFCMMFYVSCTVVPVNLAPYYMRPLPFDHGDPWFVGATVAFALITVIVVALRRRRPWLLTTWAVYVIVLLPNSGLIKHGGQLAADRYAYLSCVGWAVLAGAGLLRLWSATVGRQAVVVRTATVAACLAIVIALGFQTRNYCPAWRDSVTVWTAMVERNPRFHMGYYNLAKAYKRPADRMWTETRQLQRAGRREEAQRLRRSMDEQYRQAEQCYRQAIELFPTYPEANVDLGNMYRKGVIAGGLSKAVEHYRTALRGRPGFHMAHLNLGLVLEDQRKYGEALKHLEAAAADARRYDPAKLPLIHSHLQRVRARLKKDSNPTH